MDQPSIGILMLDTRFPRIKGDVGNPDSFPFPVVYHVVDGATPEAIVCGNQQKFEAAFVSAGHQLVSRGCKGLATTCGFLTLMRSDISQECAVPVVSSALEQVPQLIAQGHKPGILTISKADLSDAHMQAAGVPNAVPVEGVEDSHFATQILGNRPSLDPAVCEHEMVRAAIRLCHKAPDVDCIVLECTNMPPYAGAIERATGRKVVSILTALTEMHAALPT